MSRKKMHHGDTEHTEKSAGKKGFLTNLREGVQPRPITMQAATKKPNAEVAENRGETQRNKLGWVRGFDMVHRFLSFLREPLPSSATSAWSFSLQDPSPCYLSIRTTLKPVPINGLPNP